MPRIAETEARRPHPNSIVRRDALAKTASESMEAIVRKRGILFAGSVARMGEELLPQRVMFGELVGGKGFSGDKRRTGWCTWRRIRRSLELRSKGGERLHRRLADGFDGRGGSRVVHAEVA